MFAEDKDDEPAAVMVGTSGNRYDVNNISGAAKRKLIMEGEMDADEFVRPANMSGVKLKKLREKHRAGVQHLIDSKNTPNPYTKGDLVEFHKHVSEVLDTDAVKGVLIQKREGGKKWVHHSKVNAVTPEE